MTRVYRHSESETGASLMIALAMVTLIAVALVAVLGFATTSLRTVSAIDVQRGTTYAADAAVQTAIQALRTNATAGTTAPGTACPAVDYATAGSQPAVAVTCQVVVSRPAATVPPYAIMALGNSASEQGLYVSGALKINGPIASNSPANGGGSVDSVQVVGSLDLSGQTLDARGTCSGTITVTVPADKRCNTGVSIADPAYPSETPPALTSPNPIASCAVKDGVLQFSPGYYTDTSVFQTPDWSPGADPTCKSGYLYFKPGVYYFDFGFDPAFTDQIWSVPSNQRIVGGEYKGWNPNTANSFPAAPGGGSPVACKTDADGATTGVQFIFGGSSQMTVATTSAKVELCADPTPSTTNQQIAIYGQKTGADPTPQTATVMPTGAVASPSGWTDLPTNVLPIGAGTSTIDTQYAWYQLPAGANDTLTLSGYLGSSSVVPAGSINVSYALKVAHAETLSSAASNVHTLTATIPGCSSLNVPKHSTSTSTVVLQTDLIAIPAGGCTTAVQSNFQVAFKAQAAGGTTFRENLDGIELVVTYTPPAVRAQSGCVVVLLTSGGCTFLSLGTNGTKIVVWGTVYAPLTTALNDDSGSSIVELRRGIVARGVGILNVPAGDSTGNVCLGAGSPCAVADVPARVLMLTATVSGGAKLRALVSYTDGPSLGFAAQILSWNVLRG